MDRWVKAMVFFGHMSSTAAIPSFSLYGEADAEPAPAFLHAETISARSTLHNWEIAPHRHSRSVQLLILRHGAVRLSMDGVAAELVGPAYVLVPAGSVHGFSFQPQSSGHVITASTGMAARTRTSDDPMARLVAQAGFGSVDAGDYAALDHIAERLLDLGSQHRLDGPLAMALFEVLIRSLPLAQDGEGEAGDRRIAAFRQSVEQHLSEHRTAAFFASELAMTERTLTRLCRQRLGTTPLGYVQSRLITEARRLLLYTNGTVAQIADELGFADPSYFARFYKRMTGKSPRDDR